MKLFAAVEDVEATDEKPKPVFQADGYEFFMPIKTDLWAGQYSSIN